MRALLLLICLLFTAGPALAAETKSARPASRPASGTNTPKAIGKFEDWQAATHVEAGQTVCYAFTRAQSSTPAMTGRTDVILTVTERPPAGHDAVAISAGFTYAPGAAVAAQADTTSLEFYTAQRSAFARDGKAAVAAFQKARQVLARSPNPKGGTVTDQFSLRGFTAAYNAINKACPPK
jgi:hypothetical protein